MTGSLLFLALTSFVGLAVAEPLIEAQPKNEINMVAWDDVNSYTSNIQYLDLDFYGVLLHANVFLKDWEFDVDENANHFSIYGMDDGFNNVYDTSSSPFTDHEVYTFMTDNECLFAFNVASYSGTKKVYITPYWNYLKINNFYNDTILFRFNEVIDYNPFVDAYVTLNGIRVSNFGGNDTFGFTDHFGSMYPLNNSYKYVGGNFSLVYQLTNYDDQPTFHFAIGSYMMDDPNYFSTYQNGYNTGYTEGHTNGYQEGLNASTQTAYDSGFEAGKQYGITLGGQATFTGLFGAIADTPIIMLRSLFNFDLFGMNMFIIIMSLLTGIIVIYVAKKVIK